MYICEKPEMRCTECHTFFASAAGAKRHLAQAQACRTSHRETLKARFDEALRDSQTRPPSAVSRDAQRGLFGNAEANKEIMSSPRVDNVALELSEDQEWEPLHPEQLLSPGNLANSKATEEDTTVYDEYPGPAGQRYGHRRTCWEKLRDARLGGDVDPWGGFGSQDNWELARWVLKSGLSQREIENFLKLKVVSV
jgi:hypothetical protein